MAAPSPRGGGAMTSRTHFRPDRSDFHRSAVFSARSGQSRNGARPKAPTARTCSTVASPASRLIDHPRIPPHPSESLPNRP